MQMISYWKGTEVIYKDEDLSLIIGWYDHKNEHNGGDKALGIFWGDNYPQSRGVLSPCVIPQATRIAILSGLLHQAITDGNTEREKKISHAIKYFISK